MKHTESILRSTESPDSLLVPARVACQGVECSYSHRACKDVFEEPVITFYPQFEDVFLAVYNGNCTYGIIPIENTLAGSVTDNYDLALQYNLYLVGSVKVKITHCLLGVPGTSIETINCVYSHEQALHQCSDFFRQNPQITAQAFSNTAASAKHISQLSDPSVAAIGSPDCAERYGLDILSQNIQNRKDNFTRFVVISRQPIEHSASTRISLIIRVSHNAGSLYSALSRFAVKHINLLKLESRPIPDSPFEFMFYLDFAGNLSDESIIEAISDLQSDIIFMKYLGNYPEQ